LVTDKQVRRLFALIKTEESQEIAASEEQWRSFWLESGKPELKNPDAAFIGFCKSRHSRNPNP
jgi:hypothetical protein